MWNPKPPNRICGMVTDKGKPIAKKGPTTFLQWQHHFNTSIHKALSNMDKSVCMRMMQSQCTLAENIGGRIRKQVERRRKNFADDYSFNMLRYEANQKYSIDWYKRHVRKLEDQIEKIAASQ
jgi:hypothetical protein